MPPSSAEVRVSAGSYWIGNPLPIWAMLSGSSKNFGSMRHLISSEPLIHLMSDCLRGGSIRASPTRLHSEGHSAFPDQRMAPLNSRFQYVENPLLCPPGAKRMQFVGIFGDCWLEFRDLKRQKTAWWTKSRANHSPPPNPVNKPSLGPNWSNLPLPVMRTERVNERIGDFAASDAAIHR